MAKIDSGKGFSPVSSKQWKQQIQYDLGGADYNETLIWESPEGIRVKPFYNSEDLEKFPPRMVKPAGCWRIGQQINISDPGTAHKEAIKALEYGVESLYFNCTAGIFPNEALLQGIDARKTALHFSFDTLSTNNLQELIKRMPKDPAGIFLHYDPVGRLARTGNWYRGQRQDLEVVGTLLEITGEYNDIHVLGVDGGLYQNAGANTVQQLAYALSHAHEYLHEFKNSRLTAPVFTMAIGSDYFFEIAKLRALRILWKALSAEYQLPSACHILARPSHINKTIYDYNINMLRSTNECMAGIVGCADTILNLPYDFLFKERNEFSTRMARNQLLILRHEAHFAQVANPADGAYYIESLTRQLADKALALFKQIEAGGGFLKQLRAHNIQKKIGESAAKAKSNMRDGKQILVGINSFRHEAGRMKGQIETDLATKTNRRKTLIEPIREIRLGSEIEAKRLADE